MHSLVIALFHIFLTLVNADPQADTTSALQVESSSTSDGEAGTTTCFSNTWPSENGGTSSMVTSTLSANITSTLQVKASLTSDLRPMKTLSVCCCCMASVLEEPQPAAGRYLGECSKAGTLDVCGSNYTGTSGYAMEGLEGHPEQINAVCSISRCGAMRYVE
ncbi:hypothetical protein F4803DRAFT_540293 [Xylaria telfairii]|nr:hypothetical protein F4803DRAFT_540293 [Xylaria telfairii]